MILKCVPAIFQKKRCLFFLLLILNFPLLLFAQLWTGNLGAPIVAITFGKGSGTPLPAGSSSYTYTNGCPAQGSYSIEHFLYGCFINTWIPLTGDHTGDFDGNYMLVNGGSAAGTVLADTIRGLCNNTTYQFSAWLANCMRANACGGTPELPDLTLSIEDLSGNILSSYNTGKLPVTGNKTWVEYGTYYTTPTNATDLIIRIKSNNGLSCGSGFLLDDVTFRPAGPAISITVNGNSNASVIELCKGYSISLQLKSTYTAGYNNPVMHWQDSRDTGKTWHNISGATSANFFIPHRDDSVILFRMGLAEQSNSGNSNCTIYSERIWTNVHPLPDYSPLKQLTGCLNKDITLRASAGFLKYQWAGPGNFQSTMAWPVLSNLQYVNQGLYTILLTADFGCTAMDSIQLNIYPGTTVSAKLNYNVCEGETLVLSANGTGTYEWTPAAGLSDAFIASPVITPTDSTQYKVVLANIYGCKDSALVNINVFKKLLVNAGADKTILLGDTAVLDGIVKGTAVNFYWSAPGAISNVTTPTLFVSPTLETHYTLNAISTVGCGTATDEVVIKVFKNILMPNAFSPNGDGRNDVFRVPPIDNYQLVSFKIINRWGFTVFTSAVPAAGWDGNVKGQPQGAGLYIYYLEMKTRSNKKINIKGGVMLLR